MHALSTTRLSDTLQRCSEMAELVDGTVEAQQTWTGTTVWRWQFALFALQVAIAFVVLLEISPWLAFSFLGVQVAVLLGPAWEAGRNARRLSLS